MTSVGLNFLAMFYYDTVGACYLADIQHKPIIPVYPDTLT